METTNMTVSAIKIHLSMNIYYKVLRKRWSRKRFWSSVWRHPEVWRFKMKVIRRWSCLIFSTAVNVITLIRESLSLEPHEVCEHLKLKTLDSCVILFVCKHNYSKVFEWTLLRGVEWGHVNNPLKFTLHPSRSWRSTPRFIVWKLTKTFITLSLRNYDSCVVYEVWSVLSRY